MRISTMSNKINIIVEKTAIIFLALITILTFLGIISRYIFGSPIIWLYEVTLVLFSWSTFLGVSIACKKNEHIHLDIVYHYLPQKASTILSIITKIIVLLFFSIIIKDGISIIIETAEQRYNTIPVSSAWFYAAFVTSAVISIIHIINHLLSLFVDTKIDQDLLNPERI